MRSHPVFLLVSVCLLSVLGTLVLSPGMHAAAADRAERGRFRAELTIRAAPAQVSPVTGTEYVPTDRLVAIDPAAFPGNPSISLHVTGVAHPGADFCFRLVQAKDDGAHVPVVGSELCSGAGASQRYLALSGRPLHLPRGERVYMLQSKSAQGVFELGTARILVEDVPGRRD